MTRASLLLPLRLVHRVLSWAPVWVPALLIWQLYSRGLRPAEAEEQRLGDVAPAVEQRHIEARETFEWMAAEAEAWTDPVYIERRRRLREAARVAEAAASGR